MMLMDISVSFNLQQTQPKMNNRLPILFKCQSDEEKCSSAFRSALLQNVSAIGLDSMMDSIVFRYFIICRSVTKTFAKRTTSTK